MCERMTKDERRKDSIKEKHSCIQMTKIIHIWKGVENIKDVGKEYSLKTKKENTNGGEGGRKVKRWKNNRRG